MSGRGIEDWVHKNVTVADRKGSRDRARELAAQCVADAAGLGITIDDMGLPRLLSIRVYKPSDFISPTFTSRPNGRHSFTQKR
jgi:hypothetical protein